MQVTPIQEAHGIIAARIYSDVIGHLNAAKARGIKVGDISLSRSTAHNPQHCYTLQVQSNDPSMHHQLGMVVEREPRAMCSVLASFPITQELSQFTVKFYV